MTFAEQFYALTTHTPLPWQSALYEQFLTGRIPSVCQLPTGLGKTSVIAIWLLARQAAPQRLPRRLIYVVNRRTVVDQTTTEVERYQKRHQDAGLDDFEISTLRGQKADNRRWSQDPTRPAVVCGTVDMIGSRLMFRGYGLGFKSRPLHAGFLGQDALLVHDEAHLEPAFQNLLEAIAAEQAAVRTGVDHPQRPWHVLQLTATNRASVEPNLGSAVAFHLSEADHNHPVVRQRLTAVKRLSLHPLAESGPLAESLAEAALKLATEPIQPEARPDQPMTILIFAQTVKDVLKIQSLLNKKYPGCAIVLTGTMRGYERDQLVLDPIFRRFLPGDPNNLPAAPGAAVFLVATSAGEVGVDLSARHLVSDLSTFDAMAQRFGRVNRRGDFPDSRVLVYMAPISEKEKDSPRAERLEKTRALLEQLVSLGGADGGSVHAIALEELPLAARQAAFAPAPDCPPISQPLWDAWSCTTITGPLPGRPPVEPYLHGLSESEPPQTTFVWREEVQELDREEWLAEYPPETLLEDFPLLPREQLKVPAYEAFDQLAKLAKRQPQARAWVLDTENSIQIKTLEQLADKDDKSQLFYKTILLPPYVGGLEPNGLLNGDVETTARDVSTDPLDAPNGPDRYRIWWDPTTPHPAEDPRLSCAQMTCLQPLILASEAAQTADSEPVPDFTNEDGHNLAADSSSEPGSRAGKTHWLWFVRHPELSQKSPREVLWRDHVADVVRVMDEFLGRLNLPESLAKALRIAAAFHDHGKRRRQFQMMLSYAGGPLLAKSGYQSRSRVLSSYRHELGSCLDVTRDPIWSQLSAEEQELVWHLIATHHGRGRPHFPRDEVFDPGGHLTEDGQPLERATDHDMTERFAASTPRRFARLQRRYGHWGLAYLESLLRAADYAASSSPSFAAASK